MVKPINFMHSILFPYSLNLIWIKTVMFIVKITDFPYELSFIQLKQGQITDL